MNSWPSTEIAVVIPVYWPTPDLVPLIQELAGSGCNSIIVVDDGSPADGQHIFDEIRELSNITVLVHPVNLGKGAALKTAFKHLLTEQERTYQGIISMDADGQHLVKDCIRVAEKFMANPDSIVIGSRSFDGDVPWRSRFGNTFTRILFRFLYGETVTDTQTGLRALPVSVLPELLAISTQRYEYELDVLIYFIRSHRKIIETRIETVYIDNNRGSHFNAVFDSLRIYFVLFRFALSAIAAFALDLTVFYIMFVATGAIGLSLIVGRVIATAVNFLLNRSFAFHYRRKFAFTLLKFLALVIFLAFISYALIQFFVGTLGVNVIAAKLIAEGGLFIFSYLTQRFLVFSDSDHSQPND